MAKPNIFHIGPSITLPATNSKISTEMSGSLKRADEALLTISGANQRQTKGGILLKNKAFLHKHSHHTHELTGKNQLPYMISFWKDGSFLLWVEEGKAARVLPITFLLKHGFVRNHGISQEQSTKNFDQNGPYVVAGYSNQKKCGYLFTHPDNTPEWNRFSAQWMSDVRGLAAQLFKQYKNATFWTKSTTKPYADSLLCPNLAYNYDTGLSSELTQWIVRETQKIALETRRERFRVVFQSGHITKEGLFQDARVSASELPQSKLNKLNKTLENHYKKDTFGPWHTRFVHNGSKQNAHFLITFQMDMSTLSAHQLMELHR